MARTGTPTGRVALPLPQLSEERIIELAAQAGIGGTPGTFDLSSGQAEDQRETFFQLVREEQKQMAFQSFAGFNTGGFQPTPGGGQINPWAEVLINAGTNIATAIINRGSQPAQIPSMTGGTLPLPGTIPAPSGGVISQSGPGIPPQLYFPRDVSLSAMAPAGGWPTNKDGTPRRVRRDGRPWKRPTMNVANPRALGRSMRRVEGFANLAKRTISFTKKVRMKKRGRR